MITKRSLRVALLATSPIMGPYFAATSILAQGTSVAVSTVGDCSPVAADTKGDVVFNINCPTYPAKLIENRFRAVDHLLNRAETSSPMFFRPGGPTWSDFDAGLHPFSNDLAEQISTNLDKERFYAVQGSLGAWRQQFVRFLSWRLRTRGNVILFSDAREWLSTDKLEFNWPQIDQPNTIIIVDEAQFNPDLVRDFFYEVQRKTKNLKLVISYDESLNNFDSKNVIGGSALQYLPKTVLSSTAICDRLVSNYSDKVFHRPVGSRVLSTFEKLGGQSHHGFWYGEDTNEPNLWLVAAALQGWDGQNAPDGDSLEVAQRQGGDEITRQILKSKIELGSLITTVALFSRYNVAIPREFLLERMKYPQEVLAQAVANGLFRIVPGGVVLNLRGMAGLVLAAASDNPELTLDLRRRVKGQPLATSLAEAAVSFGIYDYGTLLLNISGPQDKNWNIDTSRLSELIIDLASSDNSPGRIGRTLLGLIQAKADVVDMPTLVPIEDTMRPLDLTSVAKTLVRSLGPRLVSLATRDGPSKETAWFLTGLHAAGPEIAQKIVKSLPKQYLVKKANGERNAGKLGSFLWSLDNADHGTASDVVRSLDPESLVAVLAEANESAGVGWLLEVLSTTAPDLGANVARSVSGKTLAHSWSKATRTSDLAALIWGLTRADPDVAKLAMVELTVTDASDRIREEQHSRVIGEFLIAISRLNPNLARATIDKVGVPALRDHADKEVDQENKAILLAGIAAAGTEQGKALIASETELGATLEANHEHAVQMFSTQCPWCMARAEKDRDRQHQENEARKYYLAQHGALRPVSGADLDLAAILAMNKYQPERLRNLAQRSPFHKALKQYEKASPEDKESFEQIYSSQDPIGFHEWAKTLATAQNPNLGPLQHWISLDHDGASASDCEMSWNEIGRIIENSLKLNMPDIPAFIAKADPGRFSGWLSGLRDTSTPVPKPLVELAKAGRFGPTTASWIRLTRKIDRSSAELFFRNLSTDDATLVRDIYLNDRRALKPLTNATRSSNKLDVGLEELFDQPIRLDVISEVLGASAGNILIGSHRLDDIASSSQLFSDTLPCSYERKDPVSTSTAEALRSFFTRTNVFRSFASKATASGLIDDCFQALSRSNDQLGAMFAESIGVDRILHLMEELPGAAPEIASDLYRVKPSSFDALISQTIPTGDGDDKKEQERLETVLRMTPVLADKLLSNTSNQVLVKIIVSGSFDDAVKSLSDFRKINRLRYEELINAIDEKQALTSLISHGPALPNVDFWYIDNEVRATLIKNALGKVDTEFLEQRLKAANYWPTEFLIEMVKANQDRFLNMMDESVINHFYNVPAFSALVSFDEGAKFLKRLRQSDFDAWQVIMGRLDISAIGNSVKTAKAAADRGHDVDMTEVYLPPFLEELAIYDQNKLKMLADIIGLPNNKLTDLKEDFAKPLR